MKTFKSTLLAIIAISYISLLNAQQFVNNPLDIKNDSIECLKKISVYKEFLKMNLYDKATPSWRETYETCKGFKKLIYQDGVKILVYAIKNEKDKAKKKALVDSLMHVYDERVQYFNQEGFVRGRQAVDLYNYDRERYAEANQLAGRSIELLKSKTESATVLVFMLSTELLYKNKQIEWDGFEVNYSKCIDILEDQIKAENNPKKNEGLKKVLDLIENIFGGDAPDCTGLVSTFTKTFEENKDNLEKLKKIQSFLKGANCYDEDFFFDVSIRIYELEKTAENAYLLAGLYLKKENYNEAINFLNESIGLETVDSLKASYFHDIGFVYCYKLKQFSKARTAANEALKLKSDWGKPYLIIGDAYALSSASFSTKKFEQETVFWAAVDKYYKAKSVDPEVEESANKKIAFYSAYFPNGENVFMEGLKEGQSYKVGGWINENTTVRVRK